MKRKVFLSFVVLCGMLLLSAMSSSAQAQGGGARLIVHEVSPESETPFAVDDSFPDVTLVVTPLNRAGVPFQGLESSAFELTEDGVPVEDFEVIAETAEEQGIFVLLVLDVSGSMQESLSELQEAAEQLFDYLLDTVDQDRVGLLPFSQLENGVGIDLNDLDGDSEGRFVDFTYDRNELINMVRSLDIIGDEGTPLYDAILKGVLVTGDENAAGFGSRAIIVMTDGVDEGRNLGQPGSQVANEAIVVQEARDLQIPIFTIGLGSEVDPATLQRIAIQTGGEYEPAGDAAELGALFTDIATGLKQRYVISYRSQIEPDDSQHPIQVTVRTPEGELTNSESFIARYPLIPWIREVDASLPRQAARELETFDNVKGTVTIEPDIRSRHPIQAVEYSVNDELVFTATETPWSFTWDTTELEPDEAHTLTIEALDDREPANGGSYTREVLVEECNAICVVEQLTGVDPKLLLLGLMLVLLLLVLLLYLFRRRRSSFPEPRPYAPSPATSPGIPALPPIDQPMSSQVSNYPYYPTPGSTIAMAAGNVKPGGGIGIGARAPLKTEVLARSPEVVAFLIDLASGRSFQLGQETNIGREASNDIVLDDTAISARQAKVRLQDGQFVIHDLASTNTTHINGREIARHTLKDGDQLQVGRHTLVYKFVSQGGSDAQP